MNLDAIKVDLSSKLPYEEIAYGEIIYNNCDCQILSQSAVSIDFLVNIANENESVEYSLLLTDKEPDNLGLVPSIKNKPAQWDRYSYACLLQYEQELSFLDPKEKPEHKQYTRQGMIQRVMLERKVKAEKAPYSIAWANNRYGDHILTNEHGVKYKIFLRDFDSEIGYSDSLDSKLNKLGTTKHIMFAFDELKRNPKLFARMDKTYPFIEVYCDPLNDYKITWHYPHKLPVNEQLLISRFFQNRKFIEDTEYELKSFLHFIEAAEEFETICVRPEVYEKIERIFEQTLLKELKETEKPDYSIINADLFPYQKEGIEFALFKSVAIIADEMGLGKTLQAIGTAVLKKQIFDFEKVLVVCPATLKSQWKTEIERFTSEKALIVTGTPKEREDQYLDDSYYFFIVNYETILRDSSAINRAGIDFLILDEAQRIKNFETKTSSSIGRLKAKHTLVITGTPIENRLIDIFSIISVLDPYFFGPLWEFSYQYCLFDTEKSNKINGYYNLQSLNEKLNDLLIRREKRNVLDQLPNVQQIDIHINLAPAQADYHASYARGIASILRKKFITAYDMQRMQLLLANMRMVCDSTYLIDDKTNVSPKLEELESILIDQLDLKNNNRKVIIFSEWIKVHKLIGQMLRRNKIGFVELSGKVPVKSRGELIRKFENSPECKIFLSTEAGGAGLNLQVADTLVNFELPWNPAKKNQRIGRIDRLGQTSNNLTIFNLITRNSIEQQIAAGLLVKQSLFDSVLNNDNKTDFVDFSSKGRSQFIDQLEAFITNIEENAALETDTVLEDTSIKENLELFEYEDQLQEDLDLATFSDAASVPSVAGEIAAHDIQKSSSEAAQKSTQDTAASKSAELEQVMASGMQFLSGLFKMSTGKDMGFENQQIKVNQETGEITMTFKLPI